MNIYMLYVIYIYIYDLDLYIFKSRLQIQEKDVIFYLSTFLFLLMFPSSSFPKVPRGSTYMS